jgi:protein gp37
VGDKTGIEWTDATWNPTTGCDRISPGCDHCYALTMAARLKAMGQARYQADGDPRTSGPGFGFTEHPDILDQPLRWTRPRRIFVNSMSDLFHAQADDLFIAEVFAVMSLAPQHTFQVLTKRPKQMAGLLADPDGDWRYKVSLARKRITNRGGMDLPPPKWPLPNVWLGTSVENQRYADLRIPHLARTPAAVRFLSVEPMLGPVDPRPGWARGPDLGLNQAGLTWLKEWIDWVIVGGESGPGARPMQPTWARDLRDQCVAAGVPFLFKQAGSVLAAEWGCRSHKGTDMAEWPEEFRIREYPHG